MVKNFARFSKQNIYNFNPSEKLIHLRKYNDDIILQNLPFASLRNRPEQRLQSVHLPGRR